MLEWQLGKQAESQNLVSTDVRPSSALPSDHQHTAQDSHHMKGSALYTTPPAEDPLLAAESTILAFPKANEAAVTTAMVTSAEEIGQHSWMDFDWSYMDMDGDVMFGDVGDMLNLELDPARPNRFLGGFEMTKLLLADLCVDFLNSSLFLFVSVLCDKRNTHARSGAPTLHSRGSSQFLLRPIEWFD